MLNIEQLKQLAVIVKAAVVEKGVDFYGWRNAPVVDEAGRLTHSSGWGDSATTTEITIQRALDIDKEKLNGAYGERFVLSVAVAIAAAKHGHEVALIQKQSEPGLPFDASGWLILAIDGHPLFHVAPHDLATQAANDAGLVTLVADGSPEAEHFGWKGTNKVGELGMVLDWMF